MFEWTVVFNLPAELAFFPGHQYGVETNFDNSTTRQWQGWWVELVAVSIAVDSPLEVFDTFLQCWIEPEVDTAESLAEIHTCFDRFAIAWAGCIYLPAEFTDFTIDQLDLEANLISTRSREGVNSWVEITRDEDTVHIPADLLDAWLEIFIQFQIDGTLAWAVDFDAIFDQLAVAIWAFYFDLPANLAFFAIFEDNEQADFVYAGSREDVQSWIKVIGNDNTVDAPFDLVNTALEIWIEFQVDRTSGWAIFFDSLLDVFAIALFAVYSDFFADAAFGAILQDDI